MAVILLVCLLAAAFAAPQTSDEVFGDWQKEMFDKTLLHKFQQIYPTKRSNYGSPYMTPCAAAASATMSYGPAMAAAPIPGYASAAAATPYSYSHAAYQTVPMHQGHVPHYSHPYYRMETELENEHQMVGYPDMDHVTSEHLPMARYPYGAAPMSQTGSNTGVGQAGPVVGVFSNPNVGGCSVPLLVSCSPSIAHGRIVKSQPYYDNAGATSAQQSNYRVVDENPHQEEAERNQEKAAHLSSEHSSHVSKPINDKLQ